MFLVGCRQRHNSFLKAEFKHQSAVLGLSKCFLGHPAVKAVGMQGGINSLCESAYDATPVVVVPLVTHQVDNAHNLPAITICDSLQLHCFAENLFIMHYCW